MTLPAFVRRASLAGSLAGVLAAALALSTFAAAQSPAPPQQPEGSQQEVPAWAVGRPDTPEARKLSPIPQPAEPRAADAFELDKLSVPQGFRIELYASGIANARSLRLGDKGTVFVGTREPGTVHAVVEREGKREVKTIAKGLNSPNGLAFHKGALYVAEISKIWRYDNIEDNLDNPPEPVLVTDDLPADAYNGWKFIGIGPDDKLYVPVGVPCNHCRPSDDHGLILRMDLDGQNREVIARGVRNTVGFDWHPTNRQLYFSDNGRSWLTEDLPNDELNRLTREGQHFGNPYCLQGDLLDPEFGWGRSCEDYARPVALLGPHAGALGLRFYTGTMFPQRYRNQIFIARHGSWNRTQKLGGDVVVATLNRDGTVRAVDPFLTGFVQDNEYIGRPVDVLVMPDGALLVSDDFSGAIYRIARGSVPRRR